jgi:signal transduction histidine kinase
VRTVSYLLHPPLLDEAGLGPALHGFVDGYIERSGVAVRLEISQDFQRLSPETELVLFRLVQEALTNIARHSKSPSGHIRLFRERASDGQNVVLTIEDAGRGIPALSNRSLIGQKIGPGVGLASMRERLHQVGGRLEIDSTAGRTILKAIVPVLNQVGDSKALLK